MNSDFFSYVINAVSPDSNDKQLNTLINKVYDNIMKVII